MAQIRNYQKSLIDSINFLVKDFMEDIINKTILIGMIFLDEGGELIEQYQTSGIIKAIDKAMLIIEREDFPDFRLPFDEMAMKKAEPGIYEERSTGKEIIDPDFIA